MPRTVLRTAALFVLLCTIGLPLASAAGTRGEDRSPRETRAVATFIRALPKVVATLISLWANEGSSLDPFGNPKPAALPDPPAFDEGSSLDPSGR